MIPVVIEWQSETQALKLLDQTKLPVRLVYITCQTHHDVCKAIKRLSVRGAPAIGIAAAYGAAIASARATMPDKSERNNFIRQAIIELSQTRPTAVNLFWALNQMSAVVEASADASSDMLTNALLAKAIAIHEDDRQRCLKIGEIGLSLIPESAQILTHCNTGALATGGIGTALAPIYLAHERGYRIKVFADETRPLLQGSRLTAWELMQSGVDVTIIADSSAAFTILTKGINLIIVGADRITRNGDTANKIGTYGLAILAKELGIPFYVAAPLSTFDLTLTNGSQIPIEEHADETLAESFGTRTAPLRVKTFVPAFDVTPSQYITAIITEQGILRPPYEAAIARLTPRLDAGGKR